MNLLISLPLNNPNPNLLKLRPQVEFLTKSSYKIKKANKKDVVESPAGSDESETDEEELERKLEKMKNANGRSSVSAEVYGAFNKKGQYVPKTIPKSEDQNNRIRQKLQSVWMFNNIGNAEKDILIKVMEEKKFKFFSEKKYLFYFINQGKMML